MNNDIDLKIDTQYDKSSPSITVHENLPKIPAYLTIIGNGTSGKTLLLVNLIHKLKGVIKKKRILIFTNSYSETLYDLAETRGAYIYNDIISENGENRIQKLLDYQKGRKEAGKTPEQFLIVWDDFISNAELNKRRGIFTKLFSQARHYHISLILTSQELHLIPAPIRKMSFYTIIFKIFNEKERKDMIYENSGWLSESAFSEVYDRCTAQRYDFCFIMTREGKILRNFEEVIASRKD